METATLLEIKNYLKPYGLDLAAYTDSFIERRILIRMRTRQIQLMKDYRVLLGKDAEERQRLMELLSVTVTEFFRDAMFRSEVLDPIFARIITKIGTRPMLAWSAGCATGQEPYSLAFLLETYLGARAKSGQFRIHATDISDQNLRHAAAGIYSKAVYQAIPPRYQRYFSARGGDQYAVLPSIRDLIQFQKRDLCDRPPMASVDLIFCRNVMIYLTPETKSKILNHFHSVLAPGAILVLGASEIVLEPQLFKTLDTRHKIYERV